MQLHNLDETTLVALRSQMDEIILGMVFIILGVASLALWCIYRRRQDPTLILFACLTTFYGIRLSFSSEIGRLLWEADGETYLYIHWITTYFMPVFATAFLEQFYGRGWRSSIRRLWQVLLGLAIGATLFDLILGRPGQFELANNIIVLFAFAVILLPHVLASSMRGLEQIIIKAGLVILIFFILVENVVAIADIEWAAGWEHVGTAIFIGTLGYATAYRVLLNLAEFAAIKKELEIATDIQQSILPKELPELSGLDLAVRYVPSRSVAGDFYDFHRLDDFRVGILVADVSGHGVPAAMLASMIGLSFASNRHYAADPARLVSNINEDLRGNMGSQFVTASYFFLDLEKEVLTSAAAAHPPLLIWRKQEGKTLEIAATGGLIGPFPEVSCQNQQVPVRVGDRIIAYTDGLVEAENDSGEMFGGHCLEGLIEEMSKSSADHFADSALDRVLNWSSVGGKSGLADDLCLVVVDYLEKPVVR